MLKALGMVIGGIFVGAVGMELFRKTCPAAMDKLYENTREMTSGAKEAFRAGYEKAARRPATEASS